MTNQVPITEPSTRAAKLSVLIPEGSQEVVLRNQGGPAWFHVDRFETNFEVPLLAAAGKRSEDFIACWVWHKDQVFAMGNTVASTASLMIEDVQAGTWTMYWWDMERGETMNEKEIHHDGGVLRIETPRIHHHAAFVLKKKEQWQGT